MQRLIITTYLVLFLSVLVKAQTISKQLVSNGIRFEDGLTWEQIIDAAKRENKKIFVDCMATWCLPCKKMEKDIYVIDSIGCLVNKSFISIKVQMDTSKNDNDRVKEWYSMAHRMQQQYNVVSLPTYLFFDCNGNVLHKDAGFKNAKDFIDLVKTAENPEKQYYVLLRKSDTDSIDVTMLPLLARISNELGDKTRSTEIGIKYIRRYLQFLPDSLFFTRANIEFMSPFLKSINSRDKVFWRYYSNESKVDSLIGIPGYSRSKISWIIDKEEINYQIGDVNNDTPPDWKKIKSNISVKYNSSYADEIVLSAQIRWYQSIKQWPSYTKCLVERVKRYGLANVPPNINGLVYLNNNAWAVFKYSNERRELLEAIKWTDMALAIDSSFQIMDTQANLLYKLGKKKEAIALQEKVLRIIIQTKAVERYRVNCIETLNKMKQGVSTWSKI